MKSKKMMKKHKMMKKRLNHSFWMTRPHLWYYHLVSNDTMTDVYDNGIHFYGIYDDDNDELCLS